MITVAEVKSILNITVTTYDSIIQSLIPQVTDWIVAYTNNKFLVKRTYPVDYYDDRFAHADKIFLYSNTISFVNSTSKILDSDSNLLNAGFRANFYVLVTDSQYNDNYYLISTAEAGALTLSGATLTDEDSGYYTLLELVKFPQAIKIPCAKLIGEELKNDSVTNGDRVQSERVGNTNFTYGSKMSGEYPPQLLKQLAPWKRINFV